MKYLAMAILAMLLLVACGDDDDDIDDYSRNTLLHSAESVCEVVGVDDLPQSKMRVQVSIGGVVAFKGRESDYFILPSGTVLRCF